MSGTVANGIIEGGICSECGTCLGEAVGYQRACADCAADFHQDDKAADQARRASNRARGFNALADAGYVFEVKNGAAHLIVDTDRGKVDFWPGTEKWIARATRDRGLGVDVLMATYRPIGTPAARPVLPAAAEQVDHTTIAWKPHMTAFAIATYEAAGYTITGETMSTNWQELYNRMRSELSNQYGDTDAQLDVYDRYPEWITGPVGPTLDPHELLEIARETGLRSFLHGVNATDAREILENYQLAVATRAAALPADPTSQVAKWLFDAVKMNLDALHALAVEHGCPPGATVADWLRERLAAAPADGRAAFPRYAEWLHLRTHGVWSNGVPEWARDHTGRMNDFTAATAVIEELAARAAASPAAKELPHWFEMFLTNVCEIPDRNSPEDEPDAIVATLDELRNCALNAIEQCVSYAAPQPAQADAAAREPAAWVTPDGDRAITQRQKQTMLRDGGASASSVRPYSIRCYADSAPADAGEVPLRERVERLLVDLHAADVLSEGQCAKVLDIDRITWRRIADEAALQSRTSQIPLATPTTWDEKALAVARRFTLAAGRRRAALQCAVIEAMRFAVNAPARPPLDLSARLSAAAGLLLGHGHVDSSKAVLAARGALAGVSDEMLDGGWNARDLSRYAKRLEGELAEERARLDHIEANWFDRYPASAEDPHPHLQWAFGEKWEYVGTTSLRCAIDNEIRLARENPRDDAPPGEPVITDADRAAIAHLPTTGDAA